MKLKSCFNREEMIHCVNDWMKSWNEYDLEQVMLLFDKDAEFIAWNGTIVRGSRSIKYAWKNWFEKHDNFNFKITQMVVDETQQSMAITWELNWLSPEPQHIGKKETRLGIDYLYFKDKKLLKKYSYCQTET